MKRGSKINIRNKEGKTPMLMAIEKRLPERSIRFLLDFGANQHIEGKDKLDACDMSKDLYPGIPELQGKC